MYVHCILLVRFKHAWLTLTCILLLCTRVSELSFRDADSLLDARARVCVIGLLLNGWCALYRIGGGEQAVVTSAAG